jgi:hypothetical protein
MEIKGIMVNTVSKQPVSGPKIDLTIITQKHVKSYNPEFPKGKPVDSYLNYQTALIKRGAILI